MKRLFTKTLVLALVLSYAQFLLHSEVGVKIGFQRADFEEKGSFDLNSYKIGLFYSVKIERNFFFQPEVYFSHYGTRTYQPFFIDNNQTASEYYFLSPLPLISRLKLIYIEIPLLLKYTVPLKGDLKPVIFGGVYFSFRVSKKFDFETYMDNEYIPLYGEFSLSSYYEIQYTTTDRGVVFGVGLEHGNGKTTMHVDLRANLGLVNVYDRNPMNLGKKNRSLSLMMGLSF